MAVTKEGLLVPDHALPPIEKTTQDWPLAEVRAFDKAANALIDHGLSFMVLCGACGVAGRDSVCTATGDGQGAILVECECTVHVLRGPKAYRKAES